MGAQRGPSLRRNHEGLDYIDAKDLGKASSTETVLVVRVSERWFAVTFVQTGRYLLEPECSEERFGLLANTLSVFATIPAHLHGPPCCSAVYLSCVKTSYAARRVGIFLTSPRRRFSACHRS